MILHVFVLFSPFNFKYTFYLFSLNTYYIYINCLLPRSTSTVKYNQMAFGIEEFIGHIFHILWRVCML